ncbi:MAG: bifunctional precorrin-2 dehydrogenase/sirohydrochlorin ferrochelatase [Desulfobaccales bacterium]|nr:bifunctional precorrin-2 dehydrogenase/sirohydrochlorin ferrochelatase [Desulfobaccales bacterium]
MQTYPVFAIVADKSCLVVGGGAVGERKVHDLISAGARVTVVSRDLTPTLAKMAAQGKIRYLKEDFSDDHLAGMVLVIGATDAPQVNARVSAAAQAQGIWVNIVDAPEHCTFIVPAQVRRGDFLVAISTGGASPALARKLRLELEQHFGPEYGPYLALLQGVRSRLLTARRGHPENAALFHRLVDSSLLEALARGDRQEVQQLLKEILGPALSPSDLAEVMEKAFKE